MPVLILNSPYSLASDRFPLLSGMTVTQVTPASSYVVLLFSIFKNNDIRSPVEMFNSDVGQIVKIGCNESRNEKGLCLI